MYRGVVPSPDGLPGCYSVRAVNTVVILGAGHAYGTDAALRPILACLTLSPGLTRSPITAGRSSNTVLPSSTVLSRGALGWR